MDNSSDTGFFDDFTDETVATDEQPLIPVPAQTGLSIIGEEETGEVGKEESSDANAEGEENSDADAEEEEKSEGNEVKALNEDEVKKAETTIAAKKDEEEDEDKLYPVIDDSYDNLGACQVNITYSLLPTKGESTNPGEREVLVTVYDHDDPPLIRECRLQDLGELPKIVKDMMVELAKTLPSRAEARAKEKQEEKEEREKRKARLAKSRTGKTPAKSAAKTPAKTPATKEPAGQIDLFGDLMGK
jgi:hypothetical protein